MTDPIATMKAGMRALAAALLLLGTAGYAGALTVMQCETEYGESQANAYCGPSVTGVASGKCSLSGTCSVTANTQIFKTDSNGNPVHEATVEDGMNHSVSFSLSMSLSKVDDLDICFTHNSDGTQWTGTVKAGCTTDETPASSATGNGLWLD